MSYRKIEVNGSTYEYVIGRSVIKIKDVGIFPIELYGNPVGHPTPDGNGGFQFVQNRKSDKQCNLSWHVTPKTIRGIILGQKPQPMQLMVDPYDAEIRNRIEYLKYDPEVYYDRKMEI